MPREKKVAFHELVEALLDDFEAVAGGPRLDDARLRSWGQQILAAADKRVIGEQLIALATRFHHARAALARDQLCVLATLALGREGAQDGLAAGGVGADEARRLVSKAAATTKDLSGALAAPSSGKGKKGAPTGVRLRTPR
jgi:hypothetical protein